MAIDINIPSQVKNYANLAGFPATGSLKTIYIAEDTNKTYRWTGSAYVEISASQATAWGAITGTLSNQTDLQTALDGKVDENTAITGATKTKVTYDSKGLVTSGADATTADIADSLNKRYVTDANLTVIGNTSGTNTGDQTLSGLGGVPTTRTLTINGTTQDLSANRTFTISTGMTIGTTAITSGTVGRVLFEGTGNVVQESSSLFWDNTNARLGVGTSLPSGTLHVVGSATSGFDAIRFKSQYSETGYLATSNGAVYFASGAGVTGSFLELSSAVANLRGGTTAVTFTVGSERMRVNNAGNVLINTTTDAGYKLDVNGTARVSGDLTIQNNSSLSWGNGNFVQVNNATPDWKFYVQSSLILTVGQSLFTISVSTKTRDVNPNSDNAHDIGSQFGRYRHAWLSGQLKVGDATAVNASAKVQIDSTSQGFLPPRMTTTQKNAIASPAAGLMVYDTTLNLISVYNGTIWITL